MSNRTLVYSPLSRRDLDEIFGYISSELENPAAAHETVNAIAGFYDFSRVERVERVEGNNWNNL